MRSHPHRHGSPRARRRKSADRRRADRVALRIEVLESRRMLASDWQNPWVPRDVSGDGVVVPQDALLVINELNQRTVIGAAGSLPPREAHAGAPYWSTDGDEFVTPLDVLQVVNALNGDELPPVIVANLIQDTGPFGTANADRITSDARITGRVTDDRTGATGLTAQMDGGPRIAVPLEAGGTFHFSPALLAGGGQDGMHIVEFRVLDGRAHAGTHAFSFTFDTLAPDHFELDLAAESDTSPPGDRITELSPVSLVGHTSPSSTVRLPGRDEVTTSGDGTFQWDGVPLHMGGNSFAAEVSDLAGNVATFTRSLARDKGPIVAFLAEGNKFLEQTVVPVQWSGGPGSHRVRFDLAATFDTTDALAPVEDTLLVYLVDSADESRTLLDRGMPGTALFGWSGGQADFVTGLVQFDGTTVEIDLTEVPFVTQGALKFQWINLDRDTGSRVVIRALEVVTSGEVGQRLNLPATVPRYQVDKAGQAVAESDTVGAKLRQDRDTQSNLIVQETSGRGFKTEYTYDDGGKVTSIRDEIAQVPLESLSAYDEQLYGVDGTSWRIAIEDVDGDGHLDLVGTVSGLVNGASVFVQRGRGDGRFFEPDQYPMLLTPQSLIVRDLNGDGFLDIVVSQANPVDTVPTAGAFSVLMNQGDGTFRTRRDFTLTGSDTRIALGDVNGDGRLDVVATSQGPAQPGGTEQGNLLVAFGDGAGDFAAPQIVPQSRRPIALELGDFNEDGRLDVLVQILAGLGAGGVFERSNLSLLAGNGDGTFQPARILLDGIELNRDESVTPFDMEVDDFDRDGHLDIAIATRVDTDLTPDYLHLLFGDGAGAFANTINLPTLSGASTIEALDVDGDDDLDFVVSFPFPARLMTFVNGNGNYELRYDELLATGIMRFAVGDLNEDGFVDLASIHSGRLHRDIAPRMNDGTGYFGARPATPVVADGDILRTVVTDTDGDGNNDVIVSTLGSDDRARLLTFRGDGSGTLGEPVESLVSTQPVVALEAMRVRVGQESDLVGLSEQAFVYYQNAGAGVFVESQLFSFDDGAGPLSVEFRDMAIADFSGDGLDDVAIAVDLFLDGTLDRSFVALFRNLDGQFERLADVELDESPFHVAIVPFDSDARPDLLLGVYSNSGTVRSKLQLYRGLGNNTFDTGTDVLVLTEQTGGEAEGSFGDAAGESLEWGDLNGDGRLDLVHRTPSLLSVFTGSSSGDFMLAQRLNLFSIAIASAGQTMLADIDQDGALDVLLVELDRIIVLANDGKGLLVPSPAFYLARPANGLTTGDLNGDGYPDVVVTGQDRRIHVRWNRVADQGGGSRPARYTHDPVFHQTTTFTDELGRTTIYTIDPANGNRLEERVVFGDVGGEDDLVTRYTYNADGLVQSMVDPLGRLTQYTYDDHCRLIAAAVAVGTPDEARVAYAYDETGQLIQSTDEAGHITRYEYDRRGRLLQVQYADPDGPGPQTAPVIAFAYDSIGNLVSRTDALGFVTHYEYDDLNRLTATIDALGQPETYAYDGAGNLIRSTDELGRVSTFTYDARNRVVAATDPAGGVTRFTYDLDDHVTSITDPLGRTQYMDRDARGRMTRWTDPAGQLQQMIFNAADEAVRNVDRNGHVTSFAYDSAGRMTSATDAAGQTTHYTYDRAGNQLSQTDRLGHVTTYEYDNRDRQVGYRDADGGSGSSVYDTTGNLIESRDALGRVTRYEYDALDRLIRRTNPAGDSVQLTYDAEDNIVESTDESGRATHFSYDALRRLVAIRDPAGHTQQIRYDAVGNVTEVVDQLGRTTKYTYDALDRPTAVIDPFGHVARAVYDAVGNVRSTRDEAGHTTTFQYDLLDRLTSSQDPLGGTATFSYDAVGNLTAVTDPLGRSTAYHFDALDRLTDIVDAVGGAVSFTYDAEGNRRSVTDQLGRVTTFELDVLDRVTRTTDPLGATMVYEYDRVGNILSITDKLGRVTRYEYDSLDHLVEMIDALGGSAGWTYDDRGNILSERDPNGHVTTYDYDGLNRLSRVMDPLGGTTTLAYDAVGNLIQSTDALGRTTAWTYDARNRLVTSQNAAGDTVAHTYDAVGNRRTSTDELGRVQSLQFDAVNRLVALTDPLGNTTRYDYDAAGRLVRTRDALGRATQYEYDALDRLFRTTDAEGNVRGASYDAVGNRLSSTDPLGNVTRYTFDALNRIRTTIDPLGQTVAAVDYDAMGNVLSMTDALGLVSTFAYDALDRRVASVDPAGARSELAYDAAGNLLRVTDALGNVTTYAYDARDRRIRETNQLGDSRVYAYDAVDNLVEMTDRIGRTTRFQYDVLDRLTSEEWLAAGGDVLRTIQWAYDAASQLRSVSDPAASLQYEYDAAGRATRVTNAGTPGVPVVQFDLVYDAVHNRIEESETFAGKVQSVTHTVFDALNRPIAMMQSGAGVTPKRIDLAYDAAGRLDRITRSADLAGQQEVVSTRYTFDAASRLTALDHLHGSTSVAAYTWTFDASYRITSATSPDGTSQFLYDARSQLTSADHSFAGAESYTYDEQGNRTSGGATTGPDNRLAVDDQFAYAYDAEGNRTRRTDLATGAITEYEWDYRNRLTRVVERSDGGAITNRVDFTYDPLDRRIAKLVDADGDGPDPTESEHYVYDGAHVSLVFDEAGVLQNRYLHGPGIDQILADENELGDVLWPLADHLGSVRDLVDSEGTVVNHRTYDSFGGLLTESDASVDHAFGFTGREFDRETGLAYYRARYYDPHAGRFLSEDPLGFAAGDANRFRYVHNNPVSLVDPSGLRQYIGQNSQGADSYATGGYWADGPDSGAVLLPRNGNGGEGSSTTAESGTGRGGEGPAQSPQAPQNGSDSHSSAQDHHPTESSESGERHRQTTDDEKKKKEEENSECETQEPSSGPGPAPNPIPQPGSGPGGRGGGNRSGQALQDLLSRANAALDPAADLLQATAGVTTAFAKGFEKQVYDIANIAKALTGSVAGTGVLLVAGDTDLALKIMRESGASDLSLQIGNVLQHPGEAVQRMYQSAVDSVTAAQEAARSGDYRRTGERIGDLAFRAYDAAGIVATAKQAVQVLRSAKGSRGLLGSDPHQGPTPVGELTRIFADPKLRQAAIELNETVQSVRQRRGNINEIYEDMKLTPIDCVNCSYSGLNSLRTGARTSPLPVTADHYTIWEARTKSLPVPADVAHLASTFEFNTLINKYMNPQIPIRTTAKLYERVTARDIGRMLDKAGPLSGGIVSTGNHARAVFNHPDLGIVWLDFQSGTWLPHADVVQDLFSPSAWAPDKALFDFEHVY